ncbi:diguanylate cyclase (GGDEF) domain-containing protein [Loktanella atrilutea]|uniref:Diguanylate cyclase (GGDEF) domain-containing protein n=1 Tax=Loktanella atrilutea TaxID=366533 RepID=A0A1M4STU1_LOKAT|nr:EAL domain-containing protein [Loktanella atrilutea]SHE35653.1 diguanylate cyclase (GGDEF) domain-containing protein [Loktanella atrilutea]
MLERLRERFVFETRLTIHIVRRDRLRRMSLVPLVSGIMTVTGYDRAAVTMALLVALTELAAWLAGAGQRIDGPPPGRMRCFLVWAVAVVTTVCYMMAATLFVAAGSTAMLLCACIWLFGAMVHISNSFVAVPIYNWSMLVPAYLVVIAIMQDIFWRPMTTSGPVEGYILGGLLMVYFANTVQTTQNHKDTLSAYENMRELANRRLVELEDLSLRDVLTGLPNRLAFDRIAREFLNGNKASKAITGAMFLIDLDGFKPINDSYSHAAGDALLKEVARRLSVDLTGSSIVARLGGDEFAIAWPGPLTPVDMARIAEDILQLIRKPVRFEQRNLQVSASIGIAPARSKATVDQLLIEAGQALYQAKLRLESPFVIFDPATFPRRLTLDDRARMRLALDRGEVLPFYQPQIDLGTGRIVGLEALARWEMPNGEIRAPGAFLPAINELGLQADFQQHMLQVILSDMRRMKADAVLPEQVSINLAEVTLATTSGREALLAIVARHPDLRPHLMFEVTEDIFIARSGRMIQDSISLLRLAGARISLDDFGTGFASFQHLQDLEFDELKLDTGFVRRLGQDRATDVLVKSFLDMGRGLDVVIVAEGVETAAQLDILRDMGCQIVQGYFYAPPQPYDRILQMLQVGCATAA